MQILRFEDAPEVAPKRKKSSAGWIGLGLVAALFGVSTAFASTSIQINGDAPISLAQGVIEVSAACDPTITVALESTLKADFESFYVGKIRVSNIDGTVCGGKDFKLSFYDTTTTALTCAELLIPAASDDSVAAAFGQLTLSHIDPTKTPVQNVKCSTDGIYFRMDAESDMIVNLPIFDPAGNQEVFDVDGFRHLTLETTNTTY